MFQCYKVILRIPDNLVCTDPRVPQDCNLNKRLPNSEKNTHFLK